MTADNLINPTLINAMAQTGRMEKEEDMEPRRIRLEAVEKTGLGFITIFFISHLRFFGSFCPFCC